MSLTARDLDSIRTIVKDESRDAIKREVSSIFQTQGRNIVSDIFQTEGRKMVLDIFQAEGKEINRWQTDNT